MTNKIVQVHEDGLLSRLDGYTCDELIEFFKDAKEEYGPDAVWDYYYGEVDLNEDPSQRELRLITTRYETEEEQQKRLDTERRTAELKKEKLLREAEDELRTVQDRVNRLKGKA